MVNFGVFVFVTFRSLFFLTLFSTADFLTDIRTEEYYYDYRIKRSAPSVTSSADTFVSFAFTKEPDDVSAAVKGGSVRFDCAARVESKTTGGGGSGVVKIQWQKDGGRLSGLGRTGAGGRISVLQNGSLLITQVGANDNADVDDGFYQCAAVVDDRWTFVSRKAKLVFASLSKFDDQPEDRNVLAGETVALLCKAQANPAATVTWYRDDAVLTTGGDNKRLTIIPKTGTLEIRNVQTQDQGVYKCKAENSDKARVSKSGRLRVAKNQPGSLSEPKLEMQPKGQRAKLGDGVVLECAANGQPEPEIRWLKDQKPFDINSGLNRIRRIGQGTIVIDRMDRTDAGIYTCRAVNSEGSTDSIATVELLEAPVFKKSPKNVMTKETASVDFECEAKGRPEPTISWLKNGELLVSSEYFVVKGNKLQILGLVKDDQGVYQCIADNEAGSSQAAAQLLVEVAEVSPSSGNGADVPTEPLSLTASKIDSRTVTLRWNAPLDSRGEILSYSVFYKHNGSDRERVINVSSQWREAPISRLQPSSTYFFRVVANNKNGAGLSSAPLRLSTFVEQGVPGVVRNFRGNALSSTSLKLQWDKPNGEETVAYYRIFYYLNSTDDGRVSHSDEDDGDHDGDQDDVEETEIQVSSGTTYVMDSLKKYTDYTFRIAAVNSNGTGPLTEPIVVKTEADIPTAAPDNIVVTPKGHNAVTLHWNPLPKRHQNGNITGYKIQYKTRGRGAQRHTVNVDGPARSHDITNLEPGEEYQVHVAAVNIKGPGPYSEWYPMEAKIQSATSDIQVPGAPTGLHLKPRSTEIGVYWTPPLDDGAPVRGYLIGWGIHVPDIQQQRVEPSERFFLIKNLHPNKNYVVSLRASNTVGDGFAIYETVKTEDSSTPGPTRKLPPPMALKATGLSPTEIQLTWSWEDQEEYAVRDIMYTIKYNSPRHGGGRQSMINMINVTTNSHVVNQLSPDQQYDFVVKAVVGKMESDWSMADSTKTWPDAPGSPPTDLTFSPVPENPNSVNLNWQPPSQPNGKITKYLIYYTTSANHLKDEKWNIETVLGDRMSASIRNLSTRTDYYFKIQAVNSHGYGPHSDVKSYKWHRAVAVTPVTRMRANNAANDDGKIKSGESSGSNRDKLDRNSIEINDKQKDENVVGGWSKQHTGIAIGACATALIILIVASTIYYCRRQRRSRSNAGYVAGKKNGAGAQSLLGTDAKPPPDLWIHHDHSLELRNINDRNPSIQDFKQRSPSPPVTDIMDQQPPRYCSLAAMPVSSGTLSRSFHHHQSSNSVDVPRAYPVVKAPPPQVVYTGPKVVSPRDGSGSPYGSAGTVGILTPTPPPQIAPVKTHLDQTPRQIANGGSGNPLKSFTALTSPPPPPPPLGQSTSRTHMVRHIPSNASQTASPKQKPAGIVIGTKARAMQARPSHGSDTTYSSEKETDNDLPRSLSNEELNVQIQNLDSLMKDLNAISANEFDI